MLLSLSWKYEVDLKECRNVSGVVCCAVLTGDDNERQLMSVL